MIVGLGYVAKIWEWNEAMDRKPALRSVPCARCFSTDGWWLCAGCLEEAMAERVNSPIHTDTKPQTGRGRAGP